MNIQLGLAQLHMDPPWDRSHRGRQAGAASVRVTDLSWHGLQNPRPLIKDNDSAEVLFEEYLSPSKLQALAQVEDLQQVTALEMCVDTREYSLGNFGAHLPNLSQLKLNNSLLASIRDLGTSLSHLQILWMLRCGLADLDGISSLHSLKAPDYNYRAEVKKLIPHLQFLDDIPAGQTSLQATRKLNKDWLIVKESIKEANLDGSRFNFYAGLPRQRLNPNLRLSTSPLPPTPQPWPLPVGRLPWTMPLSSPGSPLPEAFLPEELAPDTSDSSDLTHGVSRVLCGNPIKGLQERRQKLCDHSGRTAPQPPALGFVRSPLKGPEEPSGGEEDLWAQFKAWREKRQQCSQISQVCSQEEEEEDSIVLNDQEEEEKAKGPLGSCPGSPSPAPDLSKVMSSSRQPAGPSYPLIPSSLKCPSPPPLSSPKGHSRLELRGRRMSLNLTISPLSSSEAGAHLGKRLAPRTPFRCLMALRSPGSQSQPEHRGVKPSVGSGLTKATFSPQGLRPAARVQSPASFVSYTPSPLEPAFSLLRHQAERSAPEGPSYRQPIIHSPAKAPEKMLLPAPAQPLTSSSGGSSTLHRLPSRPSLGPITTPPPTPPAQPQRNSKS
uniref:Leucine-rich repeat-containing protein 56 isoform X3 n=1 Tax=Phascolarctos cinereus TaxID=38626 RepID=A0A6P5JVI1_PHACI|nr:leucine-rich repeat-containing protein 56 isoform X3 [Phascolarctos cinereus]